MTALDIEISYIDEAKSLSEADFVKRFPFSFLVKYSVEKTEEKCSDSVATLKETSLSTLIRNDSNRTYIISKVFPIRKSDRNKEYGRITVGRDKYQDIIIQQADISRYHAYFEKTDKGELVICDPGSTNGTRYNIKTLRHHDPEILEDGSKISFAKYTFVYYLPKSAYKVFLDFNQ